MDINIIHTDAKLPTTFAHSISMVIKSFKGRRDVEVHLFRSSWDKTLEEQVEWDKLFESSPEINDTSKSVIMESFTTEERDSIIKYLKEQYSTRLTAINSTPLTFPVPSGLTGLSQLSASKSIGFIEFTKIPSYTLELPIKGLYDLNQHLPIVEE